MKVLLLNPPYLPGYIHSARWDVLSISDSHWYPIYLAYCTGLLEKNGHKCKLVDAEADNLSFEETVEIAKKFFPELTVVYISIRGLDFYLELSKKIKEATGSKIIFVGPWCSMGPEDIFKKSDIIDYLVVREFDYPILDIAEGIKNKNIKGILWRSGNKTIVNKPRSPVTSEQLDEFPFVTDVYKKHLDIYNYRIGPQLYPFVDLFTGRGCPWGLCTFCLWPNTINMGTNGKQVPYRVRKIDSVIEELESILEKLPMVREVFIQDDTLAPWRARELSQAIIKAGLDITWSCYSRGDMDFETLKMMKKAGCRNLHVGYESSNLQILKNIRKGVTPKMLEKLTKNANKLGLSIHGDFIFGLPGETERTIKNTIKWAKKLEIHSYQFATPKPYPCTPLFNWLTEKGYLNGERIDLPNLSYETICLWVKKAMRECYFNLGYVKRMITKPKEAMHFVDVAFSVVPHVFWERLE